jgi:hypothetical protein
MYRKLSIYFVGMIFISLLLSCGTTPDQKSVVAENKSPGVVITRNDDANTTYIRVFIDGEQVQLYGEHKVKDYFDIRETSGCILTNGRHTIYFDAFYRFDPGVIIDKTEIIPLNINNDRHFFEIKWDSKLKKIVFARENSVRIVADAENAGSGAGNSLDKAILNSFVALTANLPEKSTVALVNITSQNAAEGEYIFEELSVLLVNSGKYTMVDRSKVLDSVRQERDFQMTGEVDDTSAVSIGKFFSADIVITGSISGENELKRLRLKALNVETGRIVGNTSESLDY